MSQRNITITKAKLKKGLHLEVEFTEKIGENVFTNSLKCSSDVHDDLRIAFRNLAPHLASLCEQCGRDGTITDQVTCRGFSHKHIDEEEKEGITLTGFRTVSNNRAVILNTPFLKFNSDEYANKDQLIKLLDACKREVYLYVFENKTQPNSQGKLDFDGKGDDHPDEEE